MAYSEGFGTRRIPEDYSPEDVSSVNKNRPTNRCCASSRTLPLRQNLEIPSCKFLACHARGEFTHAEKITRTYRECTLNLDLPIAYFSKRFSISSLRDDSSTRLTRCIRATRESLSRSHEHTRTLTTSHHRFLHEDRPSYVSSLCIHDVIVVDRVHRIRTHNERNRERLRLPALAKVRARTRTFTHGFNVVVVSLYALHECVSIVGLMVTRAHRSAVQIGH